MRVKFWCTKHDVPLVGVPFFNREDEPGVRTIYVNTMWCPIAAVQEVEEDCTVVWKITPYTEIDRRIHVDDNTVIGTTEDAQAYMKDVLARSPNDAEEEA